MTSSLKTYEDRDLRKITHVEKFDIKDFPYTIFLLELDDDTHQLGDVFWINDPIDGYALETIAVNGDRLLLKVIDRDDRAVMVNITLNDRLIWANPAYKEY